MSTAKNPTEPLNQQLEYLKLAFMREHYESLAAEGIKAAWTYVEYIAKLVEGEARLRQERATMRRIQRARFPIIKELSQFDWTWPKKINRIQVQSLFRMKFIDDKTNVIFLGGVGLGKSHLSTALAHL
jgi:DNA replication protein DnaC